MADALRSTFAWFDRHSGWAAPDPGSIDEWAADGVGRCPDGCMVAPAAPCPHGLASWWLVLRSLDRPGTADPLPPERMVPSPDRLDPARADYPAILDRHHRAVETGSAGYLDPQTGLFVLTARTLWDRKSCCERGCRHCPYTDR